MQGRRTRSRTVVLLAVGALATGLIGAATPASAALVDYQAENATIVQGVVESNHAGFTGTGFVNYNNTVGSYVEWRVNAATAGSASLAFRYANGTAVNRPMDISVNGTVIAAAVAFNGTGAWATWATVNVSASLNAGANTVRATATTANGGPNVDRLSVADDAQRPTPPGQPSCSNIGTTSLTLTWGASTDNVGVVAYDIFHEGTKIDEAPGNTTTKTLTGLQANFLYRLSVFGRDAAGNVSDSSPQAECRTQAVVDPNPPTAPTNLMHSNVTQNSVSLRWTGSTDNQGVTAYLVRVHATDAVIFTVPGNPPPTTATVTGLTCNSTYQLHVVARDAAGNISGESNPTPSFTTGACGGRGTPQPPTTVSSGWTIPWDISFLPDGQSALVTERDHFRVWRVNTSNGQKTMVGTVPNSQTTGGEGGLMGVAVSPTWNGTTDQDVFFFHTSTDNNRIARMSFNGTSLSGYTVILNGIRKNRFHNGGRLRFGPDGFLYASTGDAQQSGLAQDANSLNGKILRLTRTGAAAPGNPGGSRAYSRGHRNPQGLAWDSAGRLWSAEFGNSAADEINLILPGRNYGWPTCEGNCNTPGMENPKWTRPPSQCSCSGIAIVNDTIYMGALRGQRLWRVELNGTSAGATSSHFTNVGRIRAVEKVPGVNAIWFGTSNADNNGGAPDGADVIRRSNIQ